MDNIEYEIKEVKGYTKKYKTKNGTIKETKPNNTISLGSNSIFKAGDSVIIFNKLYYDKIKNTPDNKEEIKELQNQLNDSSKKFQELEKNYKEQFQEFQELKQTNKELETANKELQNQLNKSNDKKDTLYNSLLIAKDKLNYYEVILTKYKTMGIFQRIFKHDPTKDTPAPEPLEIPPKQ